MTEDWKPVDGYRDLYSVSNLGRIRRDGAGRGAVAGRILTAKRKRNGYRQVDLSRDDTKVRRLIHQLVAAAFLPPRPSPDHHPNHIDGNKANNVASNLEWATHAENAAHAARLGLTVRLVGERNGRAKLTAAQVNAIRALKGLLGQRELAKTYGVARSLVQRIHQGKAWFPEVARV